MTGDKVCDARTTLRNGDILIRDTPQDAERTYYSPDTIYERGDKGLDLLLTVNHLYSLLYEALCINNKQRRISWRFVKIIAKVAETP